MPRPKGPLALALALVAVALVAIPPRTLPGLKRPRGPAPGQGWYSIDPDGLYHTRRVARALGQGLPVAETDPYLAFPDGAAIPWPPYYDTLLGLALRPVAPADADARRVFLEHAVATLPAAFGVGAALLAALAAWRLARGAEGAWRRAAAATFAGVYAALGWGAINYSRVGCGDHHAWIDLLLAALLLGASAAFASGLRSIGRGLAWGVGCGAISGLMLGSWVASLEYVALLQVALGWLLVRRARERLPGAAPLGLAFHVAALVVLAPAVLSSPWKDEHPWMVVNLSWFHLAWLAVGALVFLPVVLLGRGALATGRPAARAYPLAAAGTLVVVAAALLAIDAGPARGVREGLAWVSRADSFMASVKESGALLGPQGWPGELLLALGLGVLLVPLAWGAAAWRALRSRADELVPWVVVTPVLVLQALVQKRFSDAAVVPMAVLLAWGGARWLGRAPAWSALPLALALALGGQLAAASRCAERLLDPHGGLPARAGGPDDEVLGEREALEWLRRHPAGAATTSVLAHWDRGHLVEWVADRPTVATNFGSYVGVESYRDPARFFLETDPVAAEDLLVARRVGHVFVPVSMPLYTASMCRIAGLGESDYLAGPATPTPLWQSSLLARLVDNGRPAPRDPGSLDFLRLVHVSARRNPAFQSPSNGAPRPAAFVWQRVTGAIVEWRGAPGETLSVDLTLDYPAAGHSLRWSRRVDAGADGVARLRVPYSTDEPNGDGVVRSATWSAGDRHGDLRLPAAAVAAGTSLRVD